MHVACGAQTPIKALLLTWNPKAWMDGLYHWVVPAECNEGCRKKSDFDPFRLLLWSHNGLNWHESGPDSTSSSFLQLEILHMPSGVGGRTA